MPTLSPRQVEVPEESTGDRTREDRRLESEASVKADILKALR
jgi:hypothetical protein